MKRLSFKLLLSMFLLSNFSLSAYDLSSLLDLAASGSLELKIEKIRIDEERYEERKIHNTFVPNVSGSLGHSRQAYLDKSLFSIFGTQYYSTLMSIEMVQSYPGLGRIPKIQERIAELKTFFKKVEYEKTIELVKKQMIKLFFDYALEKELTVIDKENLRLLNKLLDVAKIKQSVGLVLINDILRVEVEIANYESAVESRQFTMQNIQTDMANLVNATNPESLTLDLPKNLEFATASLEFAAIESMMISEDHEIKLARMDCQLVEKFLSGEQAARLPTFNVSSKYNTQNVNDIYKNVRDYSVNFSLSFPIFDSGDIKNEFSRQRKTLERLRLALQNKINQKKTILKKSWTDYREMSSKLRFAAKALEQSRENMRMMMARYEAGEASIIEMIDAQLTLSKSLINQAQSHRDERIRLAEIYFLSRNTTGYENLDKMEISK
ncbi:MAG: TolC family protein [Candidatus Riflebacteria bacterium]|nr:TolC family protein [Candidatus Riflebacteria bacterium]